MKTKTGMVEGWRYRRGKDRALGIHSKIEWHSNDWNKLAKLRTKVWLNAWEEWVPWEGVEMPSGESFASTRKVSSIFIPKVSSKTGKQLVGPF